MFELKEKFQSGFMAMVKGEWGLYSAPPMLDQQHWSHRDTLLLTAVAEEQQSYVLLCRQDPGDSSFMP